MKDMLKTAGILALIAFIAGGVLAFIEKITREPIRQVAIREKKEARQKLVAAHSYSIYLPEIIKADIIDKKVLPALKSKKKDGAFTGIYSKKGNFYLLRTGTGNDKKGDLTDALAAAKVSRAFFAPLVDRARKSGSKFQCSFSKIYTAKNPDGSLKGFVFECSAPEGYADAIELVTGITFDTNGLAGISDYTVIKSAETPGLGKAAEEVLHQSFTNSPSGVRTLSNFNPADTEKDVKTGATITSMALKDALYGSLRLAALVKGSLQPNITIPENQLQLVPYGSKLEEIKSGKKPAGIAIVYKAKWFARVMGHVALLSFKTFVPEQGRFRRLVLAAGIRGGNNMLTMSRLFEYDPQKKEYRTITDTGLMFYMSTEDKLKKMFDEEQKPLRKKALKLLLDLYSYLKKGGR